MISQLDLPPALHDYIKKSGVALALSAVGDDAPLLVVNKAFCELTGYAEDEVVGHNCRFLQGPDTTETARGSPCMTLSMARARTPGVSRSSIIARTGLPFTTTYLCHG